MTPDRSRVDRLLGRPELARLVDRLARRIQLGRPLTGSLTLSGLDPSERAAVAALFGRAPGSGSTMTVDLDRLEGVVRGSEAASSLPEAVELLRGRVMVRPEQALAQRRAWEHAHAVLDPLVKRRPEYAPWAAWIRARGVVRRRVAAPDDARALLSRVVTVLQALPATGEALPRLASRLLGAAHALDVGTHESALVLAALRRGAAMTGGARQRRQLWAEAGVAMDELSSTVLVHRLPLPGPLGDLTRAGEPDVMTLRQLRGMTVAAPDAPVFVCENPSVVDAAARELGGAGRSLVCIQGQPSIAADVLLGAVAGAGLRYHGDFDWGGVRIANRMHTRFGVEPWRYRASDLEGGAHLPGESLKGAPVDAEWDARLRPALERRGTRLEEEQLLDTLLADLAGT